ncbi:MAG: ornithine carbamoyltransferase [Burkholderiaceae bacterium]|jgi:ornithine carbamoyltransferase|nr:ornithine carbamoyltransferase [Burkholderiaceae bacterium]
MNLISLAQLSPADVLDIWRLAEEPGKNLARNVCWSFEGNGIRTRTTFLQAFRDLGLASVELPNLLKTQERPCDLAGYLDPFYDLYVVRDTNHQRLAEFAAVSCRPVINAMSGMGHPCEVLTDAYFIHNSLMPITQARICLWGPTTNVLRSWHELARVLGLSVHHVCHESQHEALQGVTFDTKPEGHMDIVITDGWPAEQDFSCTSLAIADLERMGNPVLLPTPPFSIGRELAFDPLHYPRFAGYRQKEMLLPVQRAIIRYLIEASDSRMRTVPPRSR